MILKLQFYKLDDLSDLPTALIVTNVPIGAFRDDEIQVRTLDRRSPKTETMQHKFETLFKQFDDQLTLEYFKSFRRVRVRFSSAEAATAARLQCDMLSFHGNTLRCFYAQVLRLNAAFCCVSLVNIADH